MLEKLKGLPGKKVRISSHGTSKPLWIRLAEGIVF
jgi:hypothetical protein